MKCNFSSKCSSRQAVRVVSLTSEYTFFPRYLGGGGGVRVIILSRNVPGSNWGRVQEWDSERLCTFCFYAIRGKKKRILTFLCPCRDQTPVTIITTVKPSKMYVDIN